MTFSDYGQVNLTDQSLDSDFSNVIHNAMNYRKG